MSLKRRLLNKDLVIGSWIQLGYPQTTEILAKAGFHFLVIDMEHTSISASELLGSIQISSLAGVPVLVRVGANDALLIKRAMDAGADGIIVPMVESREDAERARDSIYYPPKGRRGVGLARAQGFGLEFDKYRHRMETETILIVQIEHRRALDAIESILDVDGVDGFLVGPYDMSASFGKPGEFDDPEVAAALSRVAELVKRHRKPSGFHVVQPDPALLAQRIEEGYRFIAYGTDLVFVADAVQRSVSQAPGLGVPVSVL
jgi:2-keto-3-deoxy-L-rhamnonate aldolase RhmA